MTPTLLKLSIIAAFAFCANAAGATTLIRAVPSQSMKKSFNATIILPQTYSDTTRFFSTVYLLHGYSGDYRTWPHVAPLETFADRFGVIIVCPDGGFNGWYVNSRLLPRNNFATYIAYEVVAYVDSHFRTHACVSGRTIAGSSMGGHGALTLLVQYPDVFCGAASISGILDCTEFPDQWDMTAVFGTWPATADDWKKASFTGMIDAAALKGKTIIIDCGLDDFALNSNRKARALLTAAGIPHLYFERPGAHTPAYSRRHIGEHIATLGKTMTPCRGNTAR